MEQDLQGSDEDGHRAELTLTEFLQTEMLCPKMRKHVWDE
jgi:hypothetical protein